MNTSLSQPVALPPGMLVDRYKIVRSIGFGSSGDVYEAEHVDLGRHVALKVANGTGAGSEEIRERFRREARIASSLRHPNIGDVFDIGATEGGAPYLVMELLNGEPLDTWIDRGPLSLASAIEVCAQICDALAFVHTNNILHRDIKPQNIMLHREYDGRSFAKLVDFGISKPINFGIAHFPREATVTGTPHYMAPELLSGGVANERTETYSVGVVLYESLGGKPPFDAENLTALIASILCDPVPPLNIAPQMTVLVERAMNRDPLKRFGMAAELASELRRIGKELKCKLGPLALGNARRQITSSRRLRLLNDDDAETDEFVISKPLSRGNNQHHGLKRKVWILTALFVALGVGLFGFIVGRTTSSSEHPNSHVASTIITPIDDIVLTSIPIGAVDASIHELTIPMGLTAPPAVDYDQRGILVRPVITASSAATSRRAVPRRHRPVLIADPGF